MEVRIRDVRWGFVGVILVIAIAVSIAAESPQDELAARVKKVAEDVAPTAEEKAFDRIGWAKDLREAERLSRESKRPVFLFTHDGRINTGRC